jgi:hypothetical protein
MRRRRGRIDIAAIEREAQPIASYSYNGNGGLIMRGRAKKT